MRDGQRDTIGCGAGNDRVQADQLDDPAEDCETVTRTTVVPPPEGDGGPDAVAPKIDVGTATLQRLRGGRTVKVMATSSERGTIAASGFVDVAGLSLPLRTVRARVAVAGGGVELRVRFTTSQMTEIRRAHPPRPARRRAARRRRDRRRRQLRQARRAADRAAPLTEPPSEWRGLDRTAGPLHRGSCCAADRAAERGSVRRRVRTTPERPACGRWRCPCCRRRRAR